MATQTRSAGTINNDASYGTTAWVNTSNALSSNNTYSTATSSQVNSQYLKCTNFGFSIPVGSTINGIQVNVERKSNDTSESSVKDSRVRLVKGGTIQTTDKADTTNAWATSDTVKQYGSSGDTWGDSWSSTDINASDFGMVISAYPSGFFIFGVWEPSVASVDHIEITIDYTPPPSTSTKATIIII